MKKFLTVATAVFLLTFFLISDSGSMRLASYPTEKPSDSTLSDFDNIIFLVENEVSVEPKEKRPACLLFGHELTEGVVCLSSYGEYAVYPDNESSYYVVACCERCGYFSIVCIYPTALERLPANHITIKRPFSSSARNRIRSCYR